MAAQELANKPVAVYFTQRLPAQCQDRVQAASALHRRLSQVCTACTACGGVHDEPSCPALQSWYLYVAEGGPQLMSHPEDADLPTHSIPHPVQIAARVVKIAACLCSGYKPSGMSPGAPLVELGHMCGW